MADDDYTASLHAVHDSWEKLTETHSALLHELPPAGVPSWDRPFAQSERHGARIEELLSRAPGLALAGNAYHGVGVPDCIHSAQQAAETLLGQLYPS